MGCRADRYRTASIRGEEGSDHGLWDKVRRDDATAFEVLFRRHLRVVACHCRRRLSKELVGDVTERCEDAVAETFLAAWRRRESITVDDSLLPWLLTTATHCCENLARAERRRGRLCVHLACQPEPWSADDAPGDAASASELISNTWTVIDRLRPLDARVADLCLLQGVPQSEAAAMLEISEGALRGRLYRLRRLLRAEFSVSASP
jgi:RNA polymerase sigma factor (sigma-70 family)